MPDLTRESIHVADDFSGGPQEKSSRFLTKANNLKEAQNARFRELGGISVATGFNQPDNDLTTTTSTSTSSSTTTTSTSTSTSSSTTTSTSTS